MFRIPDSKADTPGRELLSTMGDRVVGLQPWACLAEKQACNRMRQEERSILWWGVATTYVYIIILYYYTIQYIYIYAHTYCFSLCLLAGEREPEPCSQQSDPFPLQTSTCLQECPKWLRIKTDLRQPFDDVRFLIRSLHRRMVQPHWILDTVSFGHHSFSSEMRKRSLRRLRSLDGVRQIWTWYVSVWTICERKKEGDTGKGPLYKARFKEGLIEGNS